jgi:hypothetical protein
MKGAALILAIGVLGLALFACAPTTPPQAESSLLLASRPAAVCPLTTFLSKVHYLADTIPPFHLPTSGFQSAPPIDNTSIDNTPSTRDDLIRAFNIAPDFFKNQLCNLSGIYIDPTGCDNPHDPTTCGSLSDQAVVEHSWGFRAFDAQGHSSGEYIGISLGFWKNGGQAPTIDVYRTKRLALLLNAISNGNSLNWPNPPTYSAAYPNNSSEMSVLTVLAHETGHVLWYDAFVSQPGKSFNAGYFCEGFYMGGSWTPAVDVPPGRWIGFAQQNSNITHNPDYISVIKMDLQPGLGHPSPMFSQAGEDLHMLLQDQGLASTLAARSPDEDFVETFQLYVLLRASSNGVRQLQQFPLTIYGNGRNMYVHNIPVDFKNKYNLLNKLSCFGHLP